MYDLQDRTRAFARDVIRLREKLPSTTTYRVIGHQLMRSGTSTAANYRASCRAQSRAAFIAKMSIVEEEADETQFWLELLRDLWERGPRRGIDRLHREADELVAIIVASKKTARRNSRPK